jgi:hypothetical protein
LNTTIYVSYLYTMIFDMWMSCVNCRISMKNDWLITSKIIWWKLSNAISGWEIRLMILMWRIFTDESNTSLTDSDSIMETKWLLIGNVKNLFFVKYHMIDHSLISLTFLKIGVNIRLSNKLIFLFTSLILKIQLCNVWFRMISLNKSNQTSPFNLEISCNLHQSAESLVNLHVRMRERYHDWYDSLQQRRSMINSQLTQNCPIHKFMNSEWMNEFIDQELFRII